MACCNKAPPQRTSRTFTPNYREKPLTEKFYARHENLEMNDTAAQREHLKIYSTEILRRLNFDPRDERLVPVTTNQEYGWIEHWGDHYNDKYDREIMHHPRRADEMTKILGKISYEMKRNRMHNAAMR